MVSRRDNRSGRTGDGRVGRGRLTQAETIRRQQTIAHAREVNRLSWAAIAKQMNMGEKEVRESFRRYISDIVPLLIAVPAEGKAAELLRDLEEIRQQQFRIAAAAGNDSAKVGALRDAAKTIQMEFGIRRTLGLMPELIGDAELKSLAREIVEILARHDVSEHARKEIAEILGGDVGEG